MSAEHQSNHSESIRRDRTRCGYLGGPCGRQYTIRSTIRCASRHVGEVRVGPAVLTKISNIGSTTG